MKKCPYCSSPIEDNAKFCIYCMKELEKKAEYLPFSNKKSKKIIVVTALAVFAALLAFALIFPKLSSNAGVSDTSANGYFESESQSTEAVESTTVSDTTAESGIDIIESISQNVNTVDSTEKDTEPAPTTEKTTTAETTKPVTTTEKTTTAETTKPVTTTEKTTTAETTKPVTTTEKTTTAETTKPVTATEKTTTAETTKPVTTTEKTTEPPATDSEPDEPVFYELVCEYRDAVYADSIYAGSMAQDIEGKIIITSITSWPSDGIIMIPETIDGKTVYGVQYGAFDLCADELKVLIVPAGVQKIDNYSLKDCDKLTDIYCFGTVLQLNEGNPYDYVRVYDGPNFHCTYDCHNGSYSTYRIYAEYWGVTFVEWDEKTYDLPR